MSNNSKNFNLQTGEEDDLAAILNQRNALTEKRRNLSSSNPSYCFKSGNNAGNDKGRFGLGTTKSASSKDNNEETRRGFLRGGRVQPSSSTSFNSKNSNSLPVTPVAEPDSSKKGIFSRILGGTTKSSFNAGRDDIHVEEKDLVDLFLRHGDDASGPLNRRLDRAGSGEEEEGNVVDDSLKDFVIDLRNENIPIDFASSNSFGSDSVAADEKKKEEDPPHSHDESCDQSSDGSGLASSASSSGTYSRFSRIFKGKRPSQTTPIIPSDSGTTQTHPDDDSDQESLEFKSASQHYTLGDHSDFLFLSAEKNGWRYCDISPTLSESHIPKLVKDYISPVVSFEHLKQVYSDVKRTLKETDQGASRPEPLAIRTLAFRVRPDVPSQTIMGAVESSFSDIPESIVLTHQEGHYRCVMTSIPCIFDAQLCVTTSEPFERTLLLRVYHAHDDETAMEKIDGIVEPSTLKDSEALLAFSTHLHLRQASSLVQLLSAENASPQTACPKETPSDTSAHLLYKYESGPSVSEHTTDESANLLPALSTKDWFIVQSSEPLCIRVWKMISEIDCVFHTISTKPLGGLTDKAGSATIDPSFCLQLQRLCCEALTIDDLRATKDDALEKHAWLLEGMYLHFLQVLESMWELYNIKDDRPSYLPEDMSVSETPSTPDYYVATAAKIVAEYPISGSDNKDGGGVQAPSKEDRKSPESAVDSIVGDVYAAYSKLNEEEFRAYCKDKNAQILARVNQIQKHEKEIIRLFEIPGTHEMQSAATEFSTLLAKAKQTKGDEVSDDELVEVPILKFPTSGNGMCYITPSKILYSTTGLMGKTLIFDLDAVQVEATSAACMTILLKNGARGRCKIWPSSLDVNHLTDFVDTLISLQLVVTCRE
jgi:hypothetical protein